MVNLLYHSMIQIQLERNDIDACLKDEKRNYLLQIIKRIGKEITAKERKKAFKTQKEAKAFEGNS